MFGSASPAQEYHKLAAAAGLEKPVCKGLNLGLSVHVERDIVIKVMICVRIRRRRDSLFVAQVQSKVRAAFAAGASGKKKLNKREQKDVRNSVRSSDSRRSSKSRPLIVSPAQLETEAETAAERLLEEIDANQG